MSHGWESEFVRSHSDVLANSYRRFTGRSLFSGAPEMRGLELAQRIYEAPFVVVSHGTQADPILNYGNATAQRLWELTWDQLTCMPSRLTAEAPLRDERARLLAAVTTQGYIDNYTGIRITQSGRRFRIERATVWNLVARDGEPYGQAALFSEWTWL